LSIPAECVFSFAGIGKAGIAEVAKKAAEVAEKSFTDYPDFPGSNSATYFFR